MSCWRITPRLPEEKKAGQVTVLFILLRMDNNRKKLPFSINGIGTIVPVCSKKNLISSNVIQISKKFGLLHRKLYYTSICVDIPLRH